MGVLVIGIGVYFAVLGPPFLEPSQIGPIKRDSPGAPSRYIIVYILGAPRYKALHKRLYQRRTLRPKKILWSRSLPLFDSGVVCSLHLY